MRTRLAILVTLVLTLVLTVGACKDHDLATLADVKSEVCACKTASCAAEAMKRIPKDTIKQTRTARTLARDMMDCRAKLENAERPSTDPDAEGSAAEPAAEGSGAPAHAPAPGSGPRAPAPAAK
ncbi:MAG TPA: hypothetical protein VF469_17425 [Kofleriaceae bacterium]